MSRPSRAVTRHKYTRLAAHMIGWARKCGCPSLRVAHLPLGQSGHAKFVAVRTLEVSG